jgi:hypothetical protein
VPVTGRAAAAVIRAATAVGNVALAATANARRQATIRAAGDVPVTGLVDRVLVVRHPVGLHAPVHAGVARAAGQVRLTAGGGRVILAPAARAARIDGRT